MKKLKIIFAGTSYFSEKHLSALIKYKYNIKAVITQPDRPSGRGQKIIFSPVKKTAIKENIPILQPLKLDDEKFQKIIDSKKFTAQSTLNLFRNLAAIPSAGGRSTITAFTPYAMNCQLNNALQYAEQ